MRRTDWLRPLVATAIALAAHGLVQAQSQREALDPAGVSRLVADSGGTAQVAIHGATGTARFVRAAPGGSLGARVFGRSLSNDAKKNRSVQFLNNYRTLFGITSVTTELAEPRMARDAQGGMHLSYAQVYHGVPVFGGELKAHFSPAGELTVVNGAFVPEIDVAPVPTRSAQEATATATAAVQESAGKVAKALSARSTLMIYREGLAQGVPGESHLAWQVEVGNRVDVREFVYVDAHTGKIIDRIAGIHEAKTRRAFDGKGEAPADGLSFTNYPAKPFWVEGQPLPTGVAEADNMILASSDIYDLFKVAFGRDSYDGKGATMDSIFNRGNGCPNASWNGTFISFCPGTTTDDVTAHEWGHAYTEYTHGLIYAWQPGALNEAYSDIWGETVDRINGRGTDTPDSDRVVGACTVSTPNPAGVTITSPASIAGSKLVGSASFGPLSFNVTGTVVTVNDGAGTLTDGCETPFANAAAVAGNIALIDRGTCNFVAKAKNAQLNGAVAVIIGNNVSGPPAGMSGSDDTVTIPALQISQADAVAIKAQAGTPVVARLIRGGVGTDNSVRWLIGEDSTAFSGALRDMYTPTCYGNPGKVSDAQYSCGPNTTAGDNGGVHNNSGVANHGYALTVDGGTYNGQSIAGIGLTKAAHIYWRAQSVYQGPASGFPDHADAIAQSCTDLVGVNLNSLTTGQPSGQVITTSDCAQVAKVALAVEFKADPVQCGFQPLLAQSPPPACTTGNATMLAVDAFDGGKSAGLRWQVSNVATGAGGYVARNWGVVNNLPGGRPGSAIFAPNADIGNCAPGGDQSGSVRLDSPEIVIPASGPTRLSFDHYVAIESGYDGGNVKISVNGGAYTVIRAADFVYNPYNATLVTAAGGNTDPLAGQPAFSGSDGGKVTGTWGRSIVNLAPYSVAGDRVRLRFEMGTDGCGGVTGWYLDDVKVYSCQP